MNIHGLIQHIATYSNNKRKLFLLLPLLLVAPYEMAFATSGIAMDVDVFCTPMPTVPPVNLCSSCHSTVTNRGPNDLTIEGMWSLSRATFSNFCPAATPPPATPAPTPPPATPAPGTGMGMSGTGGGGSVGMGVGGTIVDDDDEAEMDDDDDAPAGPLGTLLRLLTSDDDD